MRWGETDVERRFRQETHQAKRENWHRWFAWYPVRLADGTRVWLERVDRRFKWSSGSGWECDGAGWHGEYKTPDQ